MNLFYYQKDEKYMSQNIIKPDVIKQSNYFWENENEPSLWISVLVASYNTNEMYLTECIHSIKDQYGLFGIELIWIDDCSTVKNSEFLNFLLDSMRCLKNCKVVYKKMDENKGLSYCLHEGLLLCSNEYIFRMDSDDVMLSDRCKTQLRFMLQNPICVLCGTNMTSFMSNTKGEKVSLGDSYHPILLTWENYKKTKQTWILNHPTLCFKKSAILEVGNYNKYLRLPFEDLDLELRVLKKYGFVLNIKKSLLLYRMHSEQITYKTKNILHNKLKAELIHNLVNG